MIKLPGLIDPHVHLRTPGQSHKEDFSTGTKAAIAGGFTTVLDMPNNATPIITKKLLDQKKKLVKGKVFCDIGFHLGSLGEDLEELKKAHPYVYGLKIYLNQTTGGFIVDERKFTQICKVWPRGKPILVHAEEDVIASILKIGNKTGQRIHVCHVSSERELFTIIKAKKKRWKVTCGVTPHHLFLTDKDAKKLGPFGRMKPFLKSKKDQEFLWKNLRWIDMVESDHAPHALEEKKSDNPPFGVPGLETTVGLLFTAMSEGSLSLKDIKRLLHDGPSKVFKVKQSKDTFIEIDPNQEWVVHNGGLFTKCNWSPFDGWTLKGKVAKVTLRKKVVFENGKFSKPMGKVV